LERAARRINHQEAYSLGEVYTNNAESFFLRMRRDEIGHHQSRSRPVPDPFCARGGMAGRSPQGTKWLPGGPADRVGEHNKPCVDFC
jgi:hypothetical protein